MRRWIPVRAKLSFDHGHSVYLAPTVPYLTGLENSRSFGRARVRRVRRANPGSEAVYVNEWDDPLARVLREAGCLDRLPDPQQLTDKRDALVT